MTTSTSAPPDEVASPRPEAARHNPRDAGSLEAVEVEQLRDELARLRNQVANLQVALHTSRRIGMAIGILMGSRRLDIDDAFQSLRSASQRRHRKLRDIAEEVLHTSDFDSS